MKFVDIQFILNLPFYCFKVLQFSGSFAVILFSYLNNINDEFRFQTKVKSDFSVKADQSHGFVMCGFIHMEMISSGSCPQIIRYSCHDGEQFS